MADTFDTSGAVVMAATDHNYEAGAYRVCRRCGGEPHPPAGEPRLVRFSDLSPFEQGYVEALWLAAYHDGQFATAMKARRRDMMLPGFADLAPPTLARIMEDCRRFLADNPAALALDDVVRRRGRELWDSRQRGVIPGFPPLSLTLSDDGLIRFQEGDR